MPTSESKIHEGNKLPKLLYPDFPLEYSNQLPDDIDLENIHKHCVCWNCAPKLWESLPEHNTRFNALVERPNGYKWPIDAYRQTCDIRTVLKFMLTHLSTLNDASRSTWSTCEEQALHQIDKSMGELDNLFSGKRDWNDLPDLKALGESLDTLFFQGCLRDTCNYQWVTHRSNGKPEGDDFGYCSWKHGYLDRIAITVLGHPKLGGPGYLRYMVPQKRAEHIISTLLHEQVHQLLDYYTCGGSCKDATDAQKKLCLYLSSRTIGQFCEVEYQGKLHFDNTYLGHGPAFQVVCRELEREASHSLLVDKPLETGCVPCGCWRRDNPCLSHCCDSYLSMQKACQSRLEENPT